MTALSGPWPTDFWRDKRVVVTGGGGFLGSYVVESSRSAGARIRSSRAAATMTCVAKRDIVRLLEASRPDVILHLAAVVGGIGANRENPGRFFYENLMMGAQLMEQSRRFGVRKFVTVGTVCSYPKFTPVPFREERSLERLSGGDERPVRPRQEDAPRAGPGLPTAVRLQRDLPPAGEPLRPARQLRSGLVARHPGVDQEVRGRCRSAATTRSRCGAPGRPLASSSTSTMRPKGSCWRPSGTTGMSR